MGIEFIKDPDAYMMYIVSPLAGLGGGILWRPPAYRLLLHGALFFVPRYPWLSQTTLSRFMRRTVNKCQTQEVLSFYAV